MESARDYLLNCRRMADIYLQEGMLDQAEACCREVQELCLLLAQEVERDR